MKKEILDQFQGKENVTHIVSDNGAESYLTPSHSFNDEVNAIGACKLNTVETDTKHVLFLFNESNEEVGRYYMYKRIHGVSSQVLLAQRDLLTIYESWSSEYKKWIPCVSGKLEHDCIAKKWKDLIIIFRNGEWHVECNNLQHRFVIVPPGMYDFIDDFDEKGIAKVCVSKSKHNDCMYDMWGLINSDGEEVAAPLYNSIKNISYKNKTCFKLSKFEININKSVNLKTKEYLLDWDGRKPDIYPIDDWYHEEKIQSLLLFAKNILGADYTYFFNITLIKMSNIERRVLNQLLKDTKINEEFIRFIFHWIGYWYKVESILDTFTCEYAMETSSDLVKKLCFWKILYEKEEVLNTNLVEFPHSYTEENLKKIFELYQKNKPQYIEYDNNNEEVNDNNDIFLRIDKHNCKIWKLSLNGENVLDIKRKDGKHFYYKNIYSLKDYFDSLETSDPIIIRKNIQDRTIVINERSYNVDNISYYPIYKIINEMDSLIVCSISKNLVDWNNYICIDKIPLMICDNPVSIISNERIVTQDCYGRWGVLECVSGRIIVPYGKYAKIDGFKFNLAKVQKLNNIIHWDDLSEEYLSTYGIIDKSGNEVVECEYDTIYKFFDNDKWYTTLIKNGIFQKFHLGYWKFFGSFSDVQWFQYLEEQGNLEWKGGHYNHNGESVDNSELEESCTDQYSVWDALEDDPEAAGNIDYEG